MPAFLEPARLEYTQKRRAHWQKIAARKPGATSFSAAYHRWLARTYKFIIPPGARVLELGCGRGDLLAALQPKFGVGIDFAPAMLQQARANHPHLHFITADAHHPPLTGTFDFILLSDLTNDLWDVQTVLQHVTRLSAPHTRIIFNLYSRLWETPLRLAAQANLATPILQQNWLTVEDLTNLLTLANLEMLRHWSEFLFPLDLPLLGDFFNRFAARLFPLNHLCLTNFIIARPRPCPRTAAEPSVSVIVPARNEAGNIPAIFERVPQMGSGTQLVFVEGGSSDDTYAAITREIASHPQSTAILLKQTGKGKGDAVRLGFTHATGDILMILDADLTVPPEDLPRFYTALRDGKGDFINGVRLVYPMQKQAMRFLNLLGNKFFSMAFSWLLGQPIKDTLCGTKVLWQKDYQRIADNRHFFGNFDPFGDFDLLFGAAKLNLKLIDLPIRYRERTYGSTNIDRWRHGWLLLRMVAFAAGKIKFF